jgi:hypothetical protein
MRAFLLLVVEHQGRTEVPILLELVLDHGAPLSRGAADFDSSVGPPRLGILKVSNVASWQLLVFGSGLVRALR